MPALMRSSRLAATGCLAVVAAVFALLPIAASARTPRAAIVFVPVGGPSGGSGSGYSALWNLARHEGFALGLLSAGLGGDVPAVQTFLDVGQGARVDGAFYGPLPAGAAELLAGHALAFPELDRRAEDVPAQIEPGLLAQTLADRGLATAYSGPPGKSQPAALAAINRSGNVGAQLRAKLRAMLQVVALSRGDRAQVRGALRSTSTKDLVFLVGVPARHEGAWPIAVRGLDVLGGRLTSDSTRLGGFVLSTDIAPTVLWYFGVPVPAAIGGERLKIDGSTGASSLGSLESRLTAIPKRRLPALGALGGFGVALAALLWLAARRRGAVVALRILTLVSLWLPAVLLLTAALEPSFAAELVIVVGASFGLSALTLVWQRGLAAPLLPIVISLLALLVDLALGSPLTRLSLLGPNPIYGARFFGLGNELEGLVVAMALAGIGIGIDLSSIRRRANGFVICGVALVALVGWGRLGADAGGALMAGAGSGVAAAYSLAIARRSPTSLTARKTVAAAAVGCVGGLVVLLGVDALFGGGAHVSQATSSGDGLADALRRRFELSLGEFLHPDTLLFVVVAVALLVCGWLKRRALLAPLAGHPAVLAGIYGAVAAALTGALVNDSGGVVLIGGVAVVALFVSYVATLELRPRRSP